MSLAGLLYTGSNPVLTTTGYLIPGSRVTTVGEFGISREWWCKVRRTYDGGVPKTKETRHVGDHMLVQISTFFKLKIL